MMNIKENIKRNDQNDLMKFVSAIITDAEGRPLVLKRLETLKLDPGKYDMCSGHMKQGECPMQAMYREIREEIGMETHNVTKMEYLGKIKTPHPKFVDTFTNIYNIETNLTIEEINERIKNTQPREMEYGKFLKNIDMLRKIQKQTDYIRTVYTKETEEIYQTLEKKINFRKELKESKCEEK